MNDPDKLRTIIDKQSEQISTLTLTVTNLQEVINYIYSDVMKVEHDLIRFREDVNQALLLQRSEIHQYNETLKTLLRNKLI